MKKVIYAVMMVLFIGLETSCTHEYEEIEQEEIIDLKNSVEDGDEPPEDPRNG